MKVKYEFNLPEDEEELSKYQLAKLYYLALDEIFCRSANALRNLEMTEEVREVLKGIKRETEVIFGAEED